MWYVQFSMIIFPTLLVTQVDIQTNSKLYQKIPNSITIFWWWFKRYISTQWNVITEKLVFLGGDIFSTICRWIWRFVCFTTEKCQILKSLRFQLQGSHNTRLCCQIFIGLDAVGANFCFVYYSDPKFAIAGILSAKSTISWFLDRHFTHKFAHISAFIYTKKWFS